MSSTVDKGGLMNGLEEDGGNEHSFPPCLYQLYAGLLGNRGMAVKTPDSLLQLQESLLFRG